MGNAREILPVRLYRLRLDATMSQADLARLLGTGPLQVSRYETGRVLPNAEALVRISETFGCTVDYLLGLSDIAQAPSRGSTDYTPEERRIIATLRDGKISSLLHMIALAMETDRVEVRGYSILLKEPDSEPGAVLEGMKAQGMPMKKQSQGMTLKNHAKRMRSRTADSREVPRDPKEE